MQRRKGGERGGGADQCQGDARGERQGHSEAGRKVRLRLGALWAAWLCYAILLPFLHVAAWTARLALMLSLVMRGYVTQEKAYVERRPRTYLHAPLEGWQAFFKAHVRALKAILDTMECPGPPACLDELPCFPHFRLASGIRLRDTQPWLCLGKPRNPSSARGKGLPAATSPA